MIDQGHGPGWWLASDGRWYPPQAAYPAPPPPVTKATVNGCLIAVAVVAVLFVIGTVAFVVIALVVADDIDDATSIAGRDNGVEITLEEFDRIDNGMTLGQVEKIIGGEGALTTSSGDGATRFEIYSWDGDGLFGANANVSFRGGKVIAKAQVGLD